MGKVSKDRDPRLGRHVAIKTVQVRQQKQQSIMSQFGCAKDPNLAQRHAPLPASFPQPTYLSMNSEIPGKNSSSAVRRTSLIRNGITPR